MNVNVFNTVTSARVLSYRWVLHYFSTIPVGRIKIVTIYKRSTFQIEWLIATLILCISHCSESDSVSSRVFYSAVSTAPRFLFFFSFVGEQTQTPMYSANCCHRMMSSSANYRPFLSSFRHIPPQEHFVKLANSLFRQNMAVCEKCLFGQNWAKLRWRCTSGHLQG